MKTLILIFGCLLLLIIPSQAAEKNQADQSEQLNIQKERLQDIRDTASRERQAIEDRYLAGLAQLRQEALLKAQRIGLRDRMLWTEFILESYQKQKPYVYNYIYETLPIDYYSYIYGTIPVDNDIKIFRNYIKLSNAYNTTPLYADFKALRLRFAMTDSCFLNMVTDFLMDADARKLLAYIANNNALRDSNNMLIRREAQELLEVMDYFAMMSERLENQKASELADLQIWEESSIAEAQRAVPPAEAIPYGTVIAVIDYNKGSFCMIEGIGDEIIKAGDTINNAQTKNVKIVRIDIDRDSARVEFDGNGRQWAQTVGQSPNPGWK